MIKTRYSLRRTGTLLSLLLLAMGSLTEDAQGARETKDKVWPTPRDDKAIVYFVREAKFSGSARTIFVFADSEFIGTLDNGCYTFAYLAPGSRNIWSNFSQRLTQVDLKSGAVYYFDVSVRMKGWGQFDSTQGQHFVNKVEGYCTPTDKERVTAAKYIRKKYPKKAAYNPDVAWGSDSCIGKLVDGNAATGIRKIGIPPARLAETTTLPEQVITKWEDRELPKLLAKHLARKTLDPIIVANDLEPAPGVEALLRAEFTEIHEGSVAQRRWASIFGRRVKAADEAYMAVELTLTPLRSTEPFARIECARGGIGLAGLGFVGVAGTGTKQIMHNHMERFAEDVADQLTELLAEAEGQEMAATESQGFVQIGDLADLDRTVFLPSPLRVEIPFDASSPPTGDSAVSSHLSKAMINDVSLTSLRVETDDGPGEGASQVRVSFHCGLIIRHSKDKKIDIRYEVVADGRSLLLAEKTGINSDEKGVERVTVRGSMSGPEYREAVSAGRHLTLRVTMGVRDDVSM